MKIQRRLDNTFHAGIDGMHIILELDGELQLGDKFTLGKDKTSILRVQNKTIFEEIDRSMKPVKIHRWLPVHECVLLTDRPNVFVPAYLLEPDTEINIL